DGLSWVESEGQVIQGDVASVFAQRVGEVAGAELVVGPVERLRPSASRLLNRGQGVVVGDEVITFGLILQVDVLLDGAEVVAEMQFARRLHAAEDALGCRRRRGHGCSCMVALYPDSFTR